jgi:hypothetical protein
MSNNYNLDISPCRSYTDNILSVDPYVSLIIRESELLSEFFENKNMGLFTERHISKGVVVYKEDPNKWTMFNDGIINLNELLQADTSEKMYQALIHMMESYNDRNNINNINTKMLIACNGIFYITTKEIPAETELFIAYGVIRWILYHLYDILTNKNIVGFGHFVNDIITLLEKQGINDSNEVIGDLHQIIDTSNEIINNPNQVINTSTELVNNLIQDMDETSNECLQALKSALERYIENIYTVDMKQYDDIMENKPTIYIGNRIKELFYIIGRI